MSIVKLAVIATVEVFVGTTAGGLVVDTGGFVVAAGAVFVGAAVGRPVAVEEGGFVVAALAGFVVADAGGFVEERVCEVDKEVVGEFGITGDIALGGAALVGLIGAKLCGLAEVNVGELG